MKTHYLFLLILICLLNCTSSNNSTFENWSNEVKSEEKNVSELILLRLPDLLNPKDYMKSNISVLINDMNSIKNSEYFNTSVYEEKSTKFFDINYPDSIVNLDTNGMKSTYFYDSTGLIFIENTVEDFPELYMKFYFSKAGQSLFCFPYDTYGNSPGMIYITENEIPIFIRLYNSDGLFYISKIILLDNYFFPIIELNGFDKNSTKNNTYLVERRIYNYYGGLPHNLNNIIFYDKISISSNLTLKDIIKFLNIDYDKKKLDGERYYPAINPLYYLVPIWERLPYTELDEEGFKALGSPR
jgi:hypothetical protein